MTLKELKEKELEMSQTDDIGLTKIRKEIAKIEGKKYSTIISLNDEAFFHTYKAAVFHFFSEIKRLLSERQMSWFLLEQACWVEGDKTYPETFYEVRDRAIDNGWIKDGEWVSDIPQDA